MYCTYVAGLHPSFPLLAPWVPICIEPEHARNGLSINDATRPNHVHQVSQWEEPFTDEFILFGLRLAALQSMSEEETHGLVNKAWAGVKEKRALPFFRCVSGFFQQLATRAGKCRFALVDAPGWQFPQVTACGITILADQQNTRPRVIFLYRHDDYRAGVAYDIALYDDSTWFAHAIRDHTESGATINLATGHNLHLRS